MEGAYRVGVFGIDRLPFRVFVDSSDRGRLRVDFEEDIAAFE